MKTGDRKSLICWLLTLVVVAFSSHAQAGWQQLGPYGGHALKIVMHPKDPSHLYATTKNGQVYHSENRGERWLQLPFGLNASASLHAIVINPVDPRIIYLGVAENSQLSQPSNLTGVYKSQDGGQSWTLLPSTRNWPVLSLAIHPKQTEIVVAGTLDGVYRSQNSGAEWKRISPLNHPDLKDVVSLAVDPADPQVVYAGTPHLPWRTLDGGASWTSIHRGMIDDSDMFSIVVDRTDSQRVYASACSGIYRSNSRGEQWIKMQGIPGTNRRTHQILQDPVDERIVYAGTTQGLWKSLDGGLTWRKANPYPYVINSIVVDPTDHNRLYMATDRSGILKSQDGGATFHAINEGFINRNISGFLGEDTLYVSSLYDGDFGGVFSSADGGRSWKLNANQTALKGKNVISLAVSPLNTKSLYAGTYEGLLKSEDGGLTWHLVTGTVPRTAVSAKKAAPGATGKAQAAHSTARLPETKILDVRFSTAVPNTIYAATAQGLFESLDNGTSWKKNQGLTSAGAIYKVVLHPSDANCMLAQSSNRVYASNDRGVTWTEIRFSSSSVKVHDLAFKPSAPARILAGTSHGLLESADGGKSWSSNSNGLPIMSVNRFHLSQKQPGLMYFLSLPENQVYQSTDGGERWTRFDDGTLGGLAIQSMASRTASADSLFMLTDNQGVLIYKPSLSAGSRAVAVAGGGQ